MLSKSKGEVRPRKCTRCAGLFQSQSKRVRLHDERLDGVDAILLCARPRSAEEDCIGRIRSGVWSVGVGLVSWRHSAFELRTIPKHARVDRCRKSMCRHSHTKSCLRTRLSENDSSAVIFPVRSLSSVGERSRNLQVRKVRVKFRNSEPRSTSRESPWS